MNRQVSVNTSDQKVMFFDKAGEKKTLGTVFTDDFTGEGVKKYWFQPDADNPFVPKRKKQEAYRLGIASDKSAFVDPADIQETLLNAGLKIVDQYATFGGARLITLFGNLAEAHADPISYDHEFWTKRGRQVGDVFPMIELETNLVLGRMNAWLRGGIFRLICTNGMRSNVLKLPSIFIKHLNWKPEEIVHQIHDRGFTSFKGELPMGPVVGTARSIRKVSDTLSQYLERLEAGELGHAFQTFSRQFAIFQPTHIKARLLKDYIGQLRMLAESSSDAHEFRALEIVNAYTNAVNARREIHTTDRGTWHHFMQVDPIIDTTMSLSALSDLFGDPTISITAKPSEPAQGDVTDDGVNHNPVSTSESDDELMATFNENLANR